MRPKLFLYSLLIISLFCSIYFSVEYNSFIQTREDQSKELGIAAVNRLGQKVDSLAANFLKNVQHTKEEILSFNTEAQLIQNLANAKGVYPNVLGITLAFEPGFFNGKERFAPYYDYSIDSVIYVEDSYDYTDSTLATAKWYTDGIKLSEGHWSKPYFAQAAQEMLIDYVIPLKANGKNIGILDFSLALTNITGLMQNLSLGESGYSFIYDPDGTIISHPNLDNLLSNVFTIVDGKDEDIIEAYKTQNEGAVKYMSSYTFNESWFFFKQSELTYWKYVLVLAESDLLGTSDFIRKKTIQTGIAYGLFVLFSFLLIINIQKVSKQKLWYASMLYSLIILANIVLICYLNLATDFSKLRDSEERIVNPSVLKKYVDEYDEELYSVDRERYTKVPLGVYVESFEIKTSFEASVSGKVWLKYPNELFEEANPAIYFGSASAMDLRPVVLDVLYETQEEDYRLIMYKFRVTIEEDFSYEQFPFEENDLSLILSYPDPKKNILFVPDLASYDVLNPSVKPGLKPTVSTPTSTTVSSFFTLQMVDTRTNFGSALAITDRPALKYTIVIKRRFLSPIIANIIPIMVVALIMFLVLYISSRDEEKRSGMNVMNVVQSAAGFLFILILAHVNERGRIQTPEITYIELFFFCTYGLIVLEAILLSVFLRGSKHRFFKLDNLRMKVLFWPLLLTSWYISTLVWFY